MNIYSRWFLQWKQIKFIYRGNYYITECYVFTNEGKYRMKLIIRKYSVENVQSRKRNLLNLNFCKLIFHKLNFRNLRFLDAGFLSVNLKIITIRILEKLRTGSFWCGCFSDLCDEQTVRCGIFRLMSVRHWLISYAFKLRWLV